MRSLLLNRRRWVLFFGTLAMVAVILGVFQIKKQARLQVERSRSLLEKQDYIAFLKDTGTRVDQNQIRILQSTKSVRAFVRFKDSYFAATDGGLLELSQDGKLLRSYGVLDGLFESDLTSLACFNSRLFVGTQTQGLVVFDGVNFERYRWPDLKQQAITSILEDAGRLYVGTFSGGLLQFDGIRFKEVKVGTEKKRLTGITDLAKFDSRLYVGTFNDGLWVEEAGQWQNFTKADGLMSERVTGVVEDGENLFVASDFGLAVATTTDLILDKVENTQRRFRVVSTLPSLSSLTKYGSEIFFCRDDGKLFNITAGSKKWQVREIDWNRPPDLSGSRFAVVDEKFLLLGSDGIRMVSRNQLSPFIRMDDSQSLSSNLISALAFDKEGRLWVGSFRNGIDILTPQGKKFSHIETDSIREINYLVSDKDGKEMLAATSQGVISFDPLLRQKRMTTAEGLLSNSVTHITYAHSLENSRNSDLVLATSRGLSIGEPGKLRALTRLQGLPSNSLYTILARGSSIFAGTLGGLAEIENGKVVRVFKDSNSKLTHNWITAICSAGQRLFIGTYGGGVFELTPAGELHGYSSEIGKLVINPNAMYSDGERLYTGTLNGAWVFDLSSQKWIHLKKELPSTTVLSITGDGKFIYFGTTSGIARIDKEYFGKLNEE